MREHPAGPVIGGLMAAVMVCLLVMMYTDGDSAYGMYAVALIAMVVLVPLLVANLVMTAVYLLRRTVPRRTYAWMWLPAVVVLLSAQLLAVAADLRHEAFERAHPDIREVHVNLSGRSLWLDPAEAGGRNPAELSGATPEKFLSLTRYPGGDDAMSAYVRARLADDFRELRVFRGPPATTPPTLLPVRRPVSFPAVEGLLDRLSFERGEASVVEYVYYHYADHIDVVPTINLSGSQEMDLWGSGIPLVDFHLANLTPLPIARLEIDGHGVYLGSDAFAPEKTDNCCCASRNYSAHAINKLDAPLRVRWQLAESNPVWHEATVTVAPFRAGGIYGRIRSTSVDLFFQNDGSVAAEAYQLIDQPGDKLVLRNRTPVPLLSEPPCGRSADRFTDDVSVIRE